MYINTNLALNSNITLQAISLVPRLISSFRTQEERGSELALYPALSSPSQMFCQCCNMRKSLGTRLASNLVRCWKPTT